MVTGLLTLQLYRPILNNSKFTCGFPTVTIQNVCSQICSEILADLAIACLNNCNSNLYCSLVVKRQYYIHTALPIWSFLAYRAGVGNLSHKRPMPCLFSNYPNWLWHWTYVNQQWVGQWQKYYLETKCWRDNLLHFYGRVIFNFQFSILTFNATSTYNNNTTEEIDIWIYNSLTPGQTPFVEEDSVI